MTVLMLPLLVSAVALQLGDWATTWAMLRSGRGREANPALLWLMDRLGTYTALACAKLAGLALAATSYVALDALGLLATCAVYLYVVINNYRLMRRFGVTFP